MSTTLPIALYDCFSEAPFGGSQAAIVEDAKGLSEDAMARIARELGWPVTAFVSGVSGQDVFARFFSAVMEQPMCGHGAIGLFTHLISSGQITPGNEGSCRLHMRNTMATVVAADRFWHPQVKLDVKVPAFEDHQVDLDKLFALLGLSPRALTGSLPPVTARADFVHLILPAADLAHLASIAPDYERLKLFCIEAGLETVCAFTPTLAAADVDVRVRDFCPAVGVRESSSAGTTNAVLAAYLYQHGLAQETRPG